MRRGPGRVDEDERKKRCLGIGLALALGGVVASTAVSCSHGHGEMTPETIVTWKVNDVLDAIDATPAQRKVILDAAYEVLADFGKLHAQGEAPRLIRSAPLP